MATADEATWARKVSRLKIQLIENEYERRKKALFEEYLYEDKLAREKGATQQTLDNIQEAFAIRLAQIERQRIARAKEEAARLAASRADANRSRSETIEELQLRTKLKGLELEKALLALERKREIEAARKAGERLDLVEKEYDLRAKLLDAGEGLSDRLQTSVTGTFNASAIASLNSTAVVERTAKAAEATAKNTKRILEETERNAMAFA